MAANKIKLHCKDEALSKSVYVTQVFVAASLAAYALAEDDTVSLIGAMLISPMGSSIFKIVTRWRFGKNLGFRIGQSDFDFKMESLVYLVVICLVVGIITGIIVPSHHPDKNGEMVPRNNRFRFKWHKFIGLITPLLCMPIVFNMVVSQDTGAVVGIGIATSLLPPLVFCGYSIGTMLKLGKKAPEDVKKNSILGAVIGGGNAFLLGAGFLTMATWNKNKALNWLKKFTLSEKCHYENFMNVPALR